MARRGALAPHAEQLLNARGPAASGHFAFIGSGFYV
jgi:hypothetical protein